MTHEPRGAPCCHCSSNNNHGTRAQCPAALPRHGHGWSFFFFEGCEPLPSCHGYLDSSQLADLRSLQNLFLRSLQIFQTSSHVLSRFKRFKTISSTRWPDESAINDASDDESK